MAATDAPASPVWGSVVCAALCLPGAVGAQADTVGEERRIAFKWLSYQDWQPGLERISVQSPSVQVLWPIDSRWSIDAVGTVDAISGASPRYHTAISSASRMSDRRRAGDLRVTRQFERGSWTLGAATSSENDFESRAVSVQGRWSSEDNNLTWQAGAGYRYDRIGSTDDPTLAEQRRTTELLAGATMALSRADLAQLLVTWAWGQGYYDDPYKSLDKRPDSRQQSTLALRWNHHFEASATTLRSGYRYYRDSFGVRAHTVDLDAVFTAAPRVQIVPSARFYSQSAASFYFDPIYSYLGAPYPPGYLEEPTRTRSADQRLAAFGAVSVGLKIAVSISELWDADVKFERYEQRTDWHLGGSGSPGLQPLSARFVQFGLGRRF